MPCENSTPSMTCQGCGGARQRKRRSKLRRMLNLLLEKALWRLLPSMANPNSKMHRPSRWLTRRIYKMRFGRSLEEAHAELMKAIGSTPGPETNDQQKEESAGGLEGDAFEQSGEEIVQGDKFFFSEPVNDAFGRAYDRLSGIHYRVGYERDTGKPVFILGVDDGDFCHYNSAEQRMELWEPPPGFSVN